MSGTQAGGQAAARTNKEQHGEDFYKRIGKDGGSVSHRETRPFYVNRELAKRAGIKGGTTSRRGKKMDEPDLQEIDEGLWNKYVEWCDKNSLRAKMKHFEQWKEENYG